MKGSIKVLVIGTVWPEPKSSAAGARMLGLLLTFKKMDWEVVFSCPAADSEFGFDLESIGVHKQAIELNDASFDVFVKSLNPQLVLFDRFMMEEKFGWRVAEQCPQALRILDTVDLHFLRKARQDALHEQRKMTSQDLQSDMVKREIASIFRSDLSLIISEFEMNLLVSEFKMDPLLLHYLPLMVSEIKETQVKDWPPFEERSDFIFIGNFLHEPNWDAVQHLKKTIWPLIRVKMPQAHLRVYGAYPTQKVLQLNNPLEGFHLLGRAEDAHIVMEQSRVCLAPLRFGAGVKGKLLEAMVCGTPSVTTDIGAEGMQGVLAWNGGIANSPEEIVATAVHFYNDRNAWLQAQAQGIKIVNTRNVQTLFEKEWIQRVVAIFENLAEHRSQNFLGSLLQYHSMQSTKYMSRWIEEKSRA
jgi:O-antigen biosynthesis protein